MVSKSMLSVPVAYIGTNKNRLKIYDDKVVFLENNQEFQFEIKNPTKDVIGVNIRINGKLSSTSKLVLKPGESTWLDRYMDNPNKYVFETYDVEDSNENRKAIEDNGKIKFEFYKEHAKRDLLFGNGTITYTNNTGPFWSVGSPTFDTSGITCGDVFNTCGNITHDSVQCNVNNVETGRVGEGDVSNQEFQNVYYDFEYSPFKTVEYQILPLSQKNVVTASEVRKYCTECGVRIKRNNWKYCPTCGEKL